MTARSSSSRLINDIRCRTLSGPSPQGKSTGSTVIPPGLSNSLSLAIPASLVRKLRPATRVSVEPQQVSALGRCVSVYSAQRRDSPSITRPPECGAFATTLGFSRLKNNHARIGNESRIMSVHRVQAGLCVFGEMQNLSSETLEQPSEVSVVAIGLSEIGRTWVAQSLRFVLDVIRRKAGLAGPLNDDRAQRRDHTLASNVQAPHRSLPDHGPTRILTLRSSSSSSPGAPAKSCSGKSTPEATMFLKITSA